MKKFNIGHIMLLDITSCMAFVVYAASTIVIPVCLLEISKELNLDFSSVGMLELVRSLLLFLVVVTGGHAAAYLGKQRLLSVGAWITALGLLLFSFVYTFSMAIASIVIIGFGSGMLEALVNPITQDLHPKNPEKALNIVNAFFPLGVVFSSLFIGLALTLGIDWRIIFRIMTVCFVIVGGSYYTLRKVSLSPSLASTSDIINVLKRPRFWWFGIAMLCATAIEASFIFWCATFIRVHFEDITSLGAIATSIFALSMFGGRVIVGFLTSFITLRNLIKISSSIGIVVCLFIPLTHSVISFQILLACAGLSVACLFPSILALSSQELPVDSTLLIIYLSCFGIFGFGLAGWLIGWLGDFAGLRVGFTVVPVFFIVLIIALWAELKCSYQKKPNPVQRSNENTIGESIV